MSACWKHIKSADARLNISVWRLLLLSLLLLGGRRVAQATPEYAQKEGRACQYCHVSGSPGVVNVASGRRETLDLNKRGTYYGAHAHSFDGYVEPRVKSAAPTALFRFIAREALPENARRIAVADVRGDNMPRLVTLNTDADGKGDSVLTIKKWDGRAFITEFSAPSPGAADKLAVGRFASDSKTVIVTDRTAWTWNGKTFVGKSASQSLGIIGSVRLKDGSERVLAAASPTDIRAYRIDPNSSQLLTEPTALPKTAQIAQMSMRNTPEFFDKMEMPSELTRGGMLGLWTVGKNGKQLLYHVDLDQDIDIKNDPTGATKPKFILKSQGWKVGVNNPVQPSLAETFFTQRLAGDIYDVATESAHGDGVPGLLILTSEGPDGKGRSLYFFALNTAASTTTPVSTLPGSR